MEQLLPTNKCNNGNANNTCHCLLMHVSLYTAIVLCYRILCNGCMGIFYCDFMDMQCLLCRNAMYFMDSKLHDYGKGVLCVENMIGPNISCQEHQYEIPHGYESNMPWT